MNHVPINAEARGRLRLWKASLTERYARLDRLYERTTLSDDAVALARRGSITGRKRAFERLRRSIASTGAVLEGVRLEGNHPTVAWSILKARVAVRVNPDDPSDEQDCVTVNYILAGRLPDDAALRDGLWSLEIPDHALGRVLQRQSAADPSSIMFAAHHALLRLRQTDIAPDNHVQSATRFLLPAAPGAFVCSIRMAKDKSMGFQPMMHVKAHTWLNEDQLRDDQTPLVGDGSPGDRLGDGWLLPAPLRMIAMEGHTATVSVWTPGMPETLIKPVGRA